MRFEDFYVSNPNFPHRYISPKGLEKFLRENLSDYISEIGRSYENRPILMMSRGTGSTKVLAWSQMHGNESNATHAMLDLLETFKESGKFGEELFSKIKLDFIFQLNPDGSETWTRRNALDIDLNRDYLKLSSKELPILKDIAEKGNYDYALNLHEQRTIYSTNGEDPATLSFLAPAQDESRKITLNRKKSMAVISHIYNEIKQMLPDGIARYNDEFYPTSVGDNLMKMGLPTILFEGGHFPDDYKRTQTRKFYTIALYYGLKAIGDLKGSTRGYETYSSIPENRESHYDIIYRNVKLNTDFPCVLDIAVQFKEEYAHGDDDITFKPMVMEVGDCGSKKGWKEIDCTGKYFSSERKFPKLDAPVDFVII